MSTETLSPPEMKTMSLEIDGQIGTLTLDRPDAFNAMSPEMILEMTTIFGWLADRSGLRALILTGTGKAFCAGGDVNTFRDGVRSEEVDLPSEVRRGAEALHQAIVDLRQDPLPGDRRRQRPRRRRRLLAGPRLRHPDRLRDRLLRLRLRPDRGLAGRRHDLLPAARRRPEPSARAAARRPEHERQPTPSPSGS